jgi:hypothetical protein
MNRLSDFVIAQVSAIALALEYRSLHTYVADGSTECGDATTTLFGSLHHAIQ